jgi:hypothetical protein
MSFAVPASIYRKKMGFVGSRPDLLERSVVTNRDGGRRFREFSRKVAIRPPHLGSVVRKKPMRIRVLPINLDPAVDRFVPHARV